MKKQTTIRFDERMLQNLEIIKDDALKYDGLNLSNSDCVRKSLEILKQKIEEREVKIKCSEK